MAVVSIKSQSIRSTHPAPNEMFRFVRLLAPATRVVPPMRVAAPARSVAVFRGSYIAKPSSCVNIRVNHPKYKKSKDGAAMVLATPGTIAFEIAPGAGGAKTSEDADPASGGYVWEKKLSYNISASDIIQMLSWVPRHEVGVRCGGEQDCVLSDALRPQTLEFTTSPPCSSRLLAHLPPVALAVAMKASRERFLFVQVTAALQ